MARKYGLILGQGRSGTNWVVDCLDASHQTFCRNEPNECVPSFLDPLANHWRIGADGARLARLWDELVDKTATHMGERDHRLDSPKLYVHPVTQRLGIAQLSARPKARRLASRVLWSWADGEWKMPFWIGSLHDPEIFTVLKLVQSYNWASWVLDNRPDVPVVQVVRHPGGRHESFLRRYVSSSNEAKTRSSKIEQLRSLAPEKWIAERMGPVDELTLAEAETWFGVYQMEAFEQRARHSPMYLRVVYEDMVANPAPTIERIFEHFGLALTSTEWGLIEQRRGTSVFGAVESNTTKLIYGWRERLDPEMVDRIDHIVAGSSIASWWDDGSGKQSIAA